jgi:hypothetical protein
MPETPELAKMAAHNDESQIIGEFLDVIFSQGMVLCEWDTVVGGNREEQLFPIDKSIEQILADFYGIDLKKCEQERRELLGYLRDKDLSFS